MSYQYGRRISGGQAAPTGEGCAAIVGAFLRFATMAALLWSALTTDDTTLAILCWTLFALYILALIITIARADSRTG